MGNKLKKPLPVDRSFNYECLICHVKPKVYCSHKGRYDWSKSDDKIICGLCKQPVRYSAIDKHRATECPCYYPTVRQDDSRKNKNTQIRVKSTHKDEKAHKKKFITKHTPVISCGTAAEGNSQEKMGESLEKYLLSIIFVILVAILFGIYLQSETKDTTHEQIAPVIFEMHNFTEKVENETVWWSDPFFAFWRGYKMCLMVDVSGYGMSIYLYLMKGPYDDELEQSHHWPLIGTFKVVLLDQLNDDHYTQYISFDGISSNYTNRVMEQGRAPNGYGNFHFISHKTILDSNYLKNNSLYFMIFYQPNSTLKQTKNTPNYYLAPVTFEMNNFTEKMKNETMWWSDPFFAFWRGYKMCLMVDFSQYGSAMSVYLYLMKGPYDDELEQSGHWPLRGTFKIELLDQVSDDNYIEYISFDGVSSNHTNRVKEQGRAPNGYGNYRFRPWVTILNSNYLKHDILYFMISYQPNSTLKQTKNTPNDYLAPVIVKEYFGPIFAFWRGHKMLVTVYYDQCEYFDDDDYDFGNDDDNDNYCGEEICFFLRPIKGPYDDELKQSGHWPLRGAFKVEVIDEGNGNNYTHYVSFDNSTEYLDDTDGGCQQFIPHGDAIIEPYIIISYQSNSA